MKSKKSKFPSSSDREDALNALRNHKMARSVHTFVRGSTDKFYAWLEDMEKDAIPIGPAIWIGGDCHIGNLGPVGTVLGKIDVEIRDLDQTVIGNPAHDLIRLGLSLATAARDSVLSGVITAQMIEQLMEGYQSCFGEKKEDADEFPSPKTVRVTIKEAAKRSWKDLAKERIEDTAPRIPLGKTFWPISREERKAIEQVFEIKNLFCHITSGDVGNENLTVRILDAAHWIKGCSSLGKARYAVLLEVEASKKCRCLIDIKEAVDPVAPTQSGISMPPVNGERVVEGARHLSPYLGDRMVAAHILGRSVFLRELLPQDMKVEVNKLTQAEARKVARYVGMVVGNAHARQMDLAVQRQWIRDLHRSRSKSLAPPGWLWSTVVKLLAHHEGSYLEHCRKYALNSA